MRDLALAVLVLAIMVLLYIIGMQHAPQPELPLVDAAARVKVGQPPQILVPLCPVTPWNGAAPRERIA